MLTVVKRLPSVTLQEVQFEEMLLQVRHWPGHMEQVPKVELSIELVGHACTQTPPYIFF